MLAMQELDAAHRKSVVAGEDQEIEIGCPWRLVKPSGHRFFRLSQQGKQYISIPLGDVLITFSIDGK